jgi:hypothetical protein
LLRCQVLMETTIHADLSSMPRLHGEAQRPGKCRGQTREVSKVPGSDYDSWRHCGCSKPGDGEGPFTAARAGSSCETRSGCRASCFRAEGGYPSGCCSSCHRSAGSGSGQTRLAGAAYLAGRCHIGRWRTAGGCNRRRGLCAIRLWGARGSARWPQHRCGGRSTGSTDRCRTAGSRSNSRAGCSSADNRGERQLGGV